MYRGSPQPQKESGVERGEGGGGAGIYATVICVGAHVLIYAMYPRMESCAAWRGTNGGDGVSGVSNSSRRRSNIYTYI